MTCIFFFGVIVITVSTLLILFLSQIFKTRNSNLPPGKTGWPILGESLDFVTNPENFFRDRMMKYSPKVFKTSILGEKMAILCGPVGNKFIFSNDTKLFTPWWPLSVSKTLFFPENHKTSSYLGLDHHSFLKPDSLQFYVPVMDSIAKEHMDSKWDGFKEVKVHPLSKEFTFAVACRVFINWADPTQVLNLAEPFFAIVKGIVSAPVNFPGTPYSRAVKGGKVIRGKLLEILKRRRVEISETGGDCEPKDLLGRLLILPDENGKFLNEEEIVNKIIGYMVAGFYTTSSAITFVFDQLAHHPHVYDKVLEEQLEIAKSKGAGEMLTWGDIQKMKYSWNVVCESMRLRPPAQGGFKEVLTDFTFGGFHIPKGWKVHLKLANNTFIGPPSLGILDSVLPDPENFNPSRFEGSGPPPFTFVPFGGGPRMCAGKELARIKILVYIHNVVTRFRLKKANPNEKITYYGEPTPSQGLRMCLQAHEKI